MCYASDIMKITSEIKETGESEVEIIGEIAAEDFAIYWPKTIRELGETVKIDGFRPGHVPEKVLVDNLGEAAILREMAEQALGEAYREILLENKLDAIGEPNITITKNGCSAKNRTWRLSNDSKKNK